MQLKDYEFARRLEKELPQIIWLSGDEILLVEEAHTQVIAQARIAGFDEREMIEIKANFNYDDLSAYADVSLFADKKLLDIRFDHLKPGANGSKKIQSWLSSLKENVMVVVRSGKLEANMKKSKWLQAFNDKGWLVQFWPLPLARVPQWIMARARVDGLQMNPAAADLLAAQTEGNLLATKNELKKLSLQLSAGDMIDLDMVQQAVSDNAHYDVFQLSDSMLINPPQRTIKIFRSLIKDGIALQIIIWAVARDLRELTMMAQSSKSTAAYQPLEALPPAIWQRRLPQFMQALNRHADFAGILQQLLEIDKAAKGRSTLNPQLAMEKMFLELAKTTL